MVTQFQRKQTARLRAARFSKRTSTIPGLRREITLQKARERKSSREFRLKQIQRAKETRKQRRVIRTGRVIRKIVRGPIPRPRLPRARASGPPPFSFFLERRLEKMIRERRR